MERRERGRAKAAKHAAPRVSARKRAGNMLAEMAAMLVNPDPDATLPWWVALPALLFAVAMTGLVEASSWPA